LVMKAVPGAARLGAYRFGVAIRLIRNICLWKDILAANVLEKLALDEILTEKVLPHVRMLTSDVYDAITRLERVVHSLSGVWSGDDVAGPRSLKLQPLVDYALVLGKTLEKRRATGVTLSETSLLARRLKTLLVKINDYDGAREISKTFHLKEAL
ncbi:Transcriptional repressor ILP1-like protein, partial [Drosera capensis]